MRPVTGVERRQVFDDAAGACPGVILVGGSGPSDRHNGGFFDALRTHLADAGVAVLTYDKRGAGKSTGEWASATVDDLAHDAAAAVAVLQAHPRVTAVPEAGNILAAGVTTANVIKIKHQAI